MYNLTTPLLITFMLFFTFTAVLLLFLAVGLLASKKSKSTASDYLLANRSVTPLLTALSAAASKYSGYMFIGLIGYLYSYGLSGIWIILGLVVGDLFAWVLVMNKIRDAATQHQSMSFAGLISQWHSSNHQPEYRCLRRVIACVSLVFLTVYAAAQLSAAGKTLYSVFDWSNTIGTLIGAVVVGAYCFYGGLRASIWTDALQAIVMLIALGLITFSALNATQGLYGLIDNLSIQSPAHLDWGSERFGSLHALVLFALGWLFNGLGTLGQPHIMIRMMALSPTANIKRTAGYYFSWSFIFVTLIMLVGLSARAFIDSNLLSDNELALPILAHQLLPSAAVGIVAAGIFASILSTADSQVLSCSAILSEDFSWSLTHPMRRLFTLLMLSLALFIALFAIANVFTLVVFAWSALASSLAPLVIIMALGKRPTEATAISILIVGFSVSLLWRWLGLSSIVYEALPGILAGLSCFVMANIGERIKKRLTQRS